MNPDAYKNPESKKVSWACPCNGCKKAQKVVIDQIIDDYKSCPNMIETEHNLYCHTYYRHEDCVRLMNLLYKITNNSKYTLPEIGEEVEEAVADMLTDPSMHEILKRLKD